MGVFNVTAKILSYNKTEKQLHNKYFYISYCISR